RSVQKVYPKAKQIRPDGLKTDSPAFTRVHVFGYGLNGNELNQLGRLPLVFHPSPIPGGIIAVNWNQKLKSGESLTVQGRYKNNSSKAVRLILTGLSTQLDTAIIPAKSNKEFELTAVPKNEGRSVYHLQAIAEKDTLENESLPVQIDPIKPLKILILSASPDFETRFLKNWLSENGFEVAVRSAISKDKFSSEYVNMQPVKVDHLNAGVLEQFDLVIGDLSVLKSEGALKQQVTQKGLGIIVRADSLSKGSSWLQTDFPVEKLDIKNPPPLALVISGKKDRSALLKTDQSFIRNQPNTQPLVNDAQGHIFVNSSMTGAGRLVFTTITNTYNWVLASDKGDYSAFWSLLIGKTARKTPAPENWTFAQSPTVNEPVNLQLQSSQAPEKITADNIIIVPVQNPSVPFEWNNIYWPSSSGWHSVKQNNSQPAWWYVYEDKDWNSVKVSEKLAVTRQYAETYTQDASVTKQIHEKLQIEVPKIYFYMLLLGACVYLWVEGKLKN
ncbi:MAG TPA: hypothetical protein VK671_02340, partial [Mucilaginibacter sp.]|nr:hypothetical protein [Mucilaginibacter sp.]